MGKDFWYNYYMAGALQMENRPTESNDYFELALRYSPTDAMMSRVRVCQSFVYFALEQDRRSGQMLDLAITLDPANGVARSLRDDLGGEGLAQDDDAKGRKDKKDKGEDKGKGRGKPRKVGSSDQFRNYFLVQMPD